MRALLQRPQASITATPSLLISALPAREEEERRRGEKSQNKKKNGVYRCTAAVLRTE